jgi:MFS family permease
MDGNSSNDSDTPAPSPIASASLLLATVLPVLVFVGLTPILPQIEAHFHAGTSGLAFCLAATGYLVVAVTANLSLMIVAMAFAGFGIGMVAPNLFAVAAGMDTEPDRSRLFGFTKGAFYGGPLLSQFVLEPVARYANAAAAILVLGFFAALLAMWSIGRVRMERRALAG